MSDPPPSFCNNSNRKISNDPMHLLIKSYCRRTSLQAKLPIESQLSGKKNLSGIYRKNLLFLVYSGWGANDLWITTDGRGTGSGPGTVRRAFYQMQNSSILQKIIMETFIRPVKRTIFMFLSDKCYQVPRGWFRRSGRRRLDISNIARILLLAFCYLESVVQRQIKRKFDLSWQVVAWKELERKNYHEDHVRVAACPYCRHPIQEILCCGGCRTSPCQKSTWFDPKLIQIILARFLEMANIGHQNGKYSRNFNNRPTTQLPAEGVKCCGSGEKSRNYPEIFTDRHRSLRFLVQLMITMIILR